MPRRYQYDELVEPVAPPAAPEEITLDKWEPKYPRLISQVVSIAAGASYFVAIPTPPAAPVPSASVNITHVRQVQYQSHFVVPVVAVAPAPDLVPNSTLDPVRRARRFTEGLYVSNLEPITPAETITLDKWEPKYPERVSRAKRSQEGLFVSNIAPIATPETITPDKWGPAYPDQIHRARRSQEGRFVANLLPIPTPETVTLDKWEPEYPERVRRSPRTPEGLNVGSLAPVEIITPDSWAGWYPSYLARRAHRTGAPFAAHVIEVAVSFTHDLYITTPGAAGLLNASTADGGTLNDSTPDGGILNDSEGSGGRA